MLVSMLLHYSVIVFVVIFSFSSLILPKPTIAEAKKSWHVGKHLILIQKGLGLIFRDAGQFKSVPSDSGDVQ